MSSFEVVMPVRGLYIMVRHDGTEIGRYSGDWGRGFTAYEVTSSIVREIGHYPTDTQAQDAVLALDDAKEFLAALPVASVQVDIE